MARAVSGGLIVLVWTAVKTTMRLRRQQQRKIASSKSAKIGVVSFQIVVVCVFAPWLPTHLSSVRLPECQFCLSLCLSVCLSVPHCSRKPKDSDENVDLACAVGVER